MNHESKYLDVAKIYHAIAQDHLHSGDIGLAKVYMRIAASCLRRNNIEQMCIEAQLNVQEKHHHG